MVLGLVLSKHINVLLSLKISLLLKIISLLLWYSMQLTSIEFLQNKKERILI